jgi:sialate O-acetylesterase
VVNEMGAGKVICRFDHADGLRASDGFELKCFELAGEDGRFYPARAVVAGSTVEVTCPDVPSPEQVSFFYPGREPATLINGAGLPASGFVASVPYSM